MKPLMFSKPEESRYRQFTQGFRKPDYDLLCLHIGLQQYDKPGMYLTYAALLTPVQGVEQDRDERLRWESPEVGRASVSAVGMDEEDEPKASAKSSLFITKLTVGQTSA